MQASNPRLKLVSADLLKDPDAVSAILDEFGPFTAVVHCVGMLLPSSLNGLISGSGSVPGEGVPLALRLCSRSTAKLHCARFSGLPWMGGALCVDCGST